MPTASNTETYSELSFSPNVALIAVVRRFVADFYVRVLEDEEVTSRLVVATHELLENAIRYSVDGQSTIRIGVRRGADTIGAAIETRNKTSSANAAALTALVEEIQASTDRRDFYVVLMKRTSKREDGSGLGLGRIHGESEMDLTCTTDGEVVTLRASANFPMKGAA